MKASQAYNLINKNLRGVFMRSLIKSKGWSEIEARSYLVEYVTSGSKLSLNCFMETK